MLIAAFLSSSLFSAAILKLIPSQLGLIIYNIVNFYVLIVVIWAVLSWFRRRAGFLNDFYQVLDKIVSPVMKPFRKIIPTAGGMDFTPLIVIILLQVLVNVLISL